MIVTYDNEKKKDKLRNNSVMSDAKMKMKFKS
jgi:hypothetical protein